MSIRELWSDIKCYEGIYKVSNCGNILSCKKDILLKPSFNNSGYLYVILYYVFQFFLFLINLKQIYLMI